MPNPRTARPVRTGKSSEGSGRGKKIAIATILLLLVAAVGYAMYGGEDPGVARIEALRDQMEGANDDQRRELFQQMRQEYEQLPEATREQLRDEREARRELEEGKRMAEFFAMSAPEQLKALDDDIKEDEERRKEWEKRRAQRGGGDRGRGGPGGGGGPGGDMGRRGDRGRDSSGDPNARRKSYLDRSSPQSRAMRSEYYRMRAERRRQLGLASR